MTIKNTEGKVEVGR